MKELNSILCIVIMFSCGNVLNNQQNYRLENIVGKWLLTVKQVNYPSLIFSSDSTAIFNSMGDTVYRYKFYIDKTELVLRDINGKTTKDKILKVDSDSLIFETLADNKTVQKYCKAHKK